MSMKATNRTSLINLIKKLAVLVGVTGFSFLISLPVFAQTNPNLSPPPAALSAPPARPVPPPGRPPIPPQASGRLPAAPPPPPPTYSSRPGRRLASDPPADKGTAPASNPPAANQTDTQPASEPPAANQTNLPQS